MTLQKISHRQASRASNPSRILIIWHLSPTCKYNFLTDLITCRTASQTVVRNLEDGVMFDEVYISLNSLK